MRQMDHYGLRMCKYQGELFLTSLEAVSCSSPVFLRRFMYSGVAQRMDSGGFLFESLDVAGAIEEIEEQFGKSEYGKRKYGREEIYWMGYLYRYWAYTRECSSRNVYRIMKPDELRGLYFPYHSLDPAQAVERILESRGNASEEDMIKRGVEIMRRIRALQKRSERE